MNRFRFTSYIASLITVSLLAYIVQVVFLVSTPAFAAPNLQINYQGKLTGATNIAVPDGVYHMRFWLLTSPSAGTTTALWTEDRSTAAGDRVTVRSGLFSIMLGSSTPLTNVNFNQTLYLGIEIGGSAGAPTWDGEMSPRKVLGTVPAAFESQSLGGASSTQYLRSDAPTTLSTTTAATLLTITQQGTGDILNIFDGTTEVFSILDGGNVGIGSTSPSAKLTIAGGNLHVGGFITATSTATSTFSGGISMANFALTGSATSTAQNGFDISAGCYAVNGVCLTSGGGITAIGPTGQTSTGATVTFATSSDTNLGITITGVGDTQTFTPTWTGTLADSRVADDITVTGGTLGSNNISSGATWTTLGQLTIGDGGDRIDISSSGWDVTNSVITNATWQGNLIGTTYGGTGNSATPNDGELLIGDGAGFSLATLTAGSGVSIINSAGGISIASTLGTSVDLASAEVTGILGFANGGTGTTTFSNGGLVFSDGSTLTQNTSNLFWDNTNTRLGIGSSSPYAKLSVSVNNGDTATTLFAISSSTSATTTSLFTVSNTGDVTAYGDIYSKGIQWTARTAASTTASYSGVTYGNGLFVAVGTNVGAMTSPDGVNWTPRSAAGNNDSWNSVTYGNGLFVAVGSSGDRVMTSPDGITWTVRSAAGDNDSWQSITYGNRLFVAVGSYSGAMTSPDGINWTQRSVAGDDDVWLSVVYGYSTSTGGLFVAVSDYSDDSKRLMTSPDGITWTDYSVSVNYLSSVTYGNGLFVAVQYGGSGNLLTSSDGITWTTRTFAFAANFAPNTVTYGNGLFVAAEQNRLGTSPDGINWTSRTVPSGNWWGVTYGNGTFVAVGNGVNNVITSGKSEVNLLAGNNLYQGDTTFMGSFNIGTTTPTTTSPYSKLTVWGNTTGNIFEAITNASSSALKVSGTGFGTTTVTGLSINGSATSTSNVGFNITTGCYAVNSVCLANSTFSTTSIDTSAKLAAIVTDETGSGSLVFSSNATLASTTLTGNTTFADATSTTFFATTASSTNLYASLASLTNGTSSAWFSTTASSTNLYTRFASTSVLSVSGTSYLASLLATASSTIGGGTQATGLTINGGATTTGNSYIRGGLTINAMYSAGANTSNGLTLTYSNPQDAQPGYGIVINGYGSTNKNLTSIHNNLGVDYSGLPTVTGVANEWWSSDNGTLYGFRNYSTTTRVVLADDNGVFYGLANQFSNNQVAGNNNIYYGVYNDISASNAGADFETVYGTWSRGTTFSDGNDIFYGNYVTSSSSSNGGTQYGFYADLTPGTATKYAAILLGGNVGIGTTTPYAKLSVHANNGDTNTSLFAVASSTASATTTLFSISNTGSTTAANGFNITSGCYAVNGTCLTTGSSFGTTSIDTSAKLAGIVTDETGSGSLVFSSNSTLASTTLTGNTTFADATSTTFYSTLASSTNLYTRFASTSVLSVSGTSYLASLLASASSTIGGGTQASGLTIYGGATTTLNHYFASSVGIGTNAPPWGLTVASSTAPQIGLSDGVARNTFTMRAAGGNLYIGTTSASYATSSTPILTMKGGVEVGYGESAPRIGINTANPTAMLDIAAPNQMNSPLIHLGNAAQSAGIYNSILIDTPSAATYAGTHPLAAGSIGFVAPYGANTYSGMITTGFGGVSVYQLDGCCSAGGVTGYKAFGTNSAGEIMRISDGGSFGQVGIGTTTPYAKLAIHAKNGDTNTTLFAIGSSTASATSTLFSISNTGSTTASNGFNISSGCFAINGTCVGGGASTYLSLSDTPSSYNANRIVFTNSGASALTDSASFTFNGTVLSTPSLIATASSTIGGGTQVSGLTVSGGATTTLNAYFASNVGIGTTSPLSLLSIQKTSGITGTTTVGINQYFSFANATQNAQQFGDYSYIVNAPSATTTLVGKLMRIEDSSTYGNTLRGLEVQAERGTNTKGENTALSGIARTFGVRGITMGDAGDTYLPAGVFAESRGTTQGNALRAYSGTITTESLVHLYQDVSTFTGTGLKMNFGNTGGTFATSSKFIDLQVAGTSMFTVTKNGTTTIGDGTTNRQAGLQIGFGGLCVDNDGSCVASTTGRISSVSSYTGNSDLAEMYFSSENIEPGDIVHTTGLLSIGRARQDTKDIILGVVSTKPGLLMGFDDTPSIIGQSLHPVALAGRVPIKLSTEGGPIKAGDKISLSSLPGIGMKATTSGSIVGVALEDFDGTHAYSQGFVDQFGDDMPNQDVVPDATSTDALKSDGCYFGGGGALGSAPCVQKKPVVENTQSIGGLSEEKDALRALRTQTAASVTLASGKKVEVGRALLFVNLSWYPGDAEERIFAELLASTSSSTAESGETLWSRVKSLAQNFVGGVLSILKLDAKEVKTDKLCVGETCVDEATLKALLIKANTPAATSGGVADPSAVVVEVKTIDPSPSDTSAETPVPNEAPEEVIAPSADSASEQSSTETSPVIAPETAAPAEPAPELAPPASEPAASLAPEPEPTPPSPEPTSAVAP